MSDDKNNIGSPDNKLIALSDPDEVRYWTEALGISDAELHEAVTAVGNSVAKVREYIESH
jgi:hypothetical protein